MLALGLLLFSSKAFAGRDLRYNLAADLAVTSSSFAGWAVMEFASDHIAPSKCRWCQAGGFDNWGHDNLKWSSTKTASIISNITGYVIAPSLAFGLDALFADRAGEIDNFWVDALVISEAATTAAFFSQIMKVAVGRERPEVHYGIEPPKPSLNTSFYSGHTSLAFSLAVASGTVATMRGYEYTPVIWGAGLGVAALTGYLRVAANKHYLTDAITGAFIGSAFGFAVPYLFHRPRNGMMISAFPLEGGAIFSLASVY